MRGEETRAALTAGLRVVAGLKARFREDVGDETSLKAWEGSVST